jgi:hypothetical protein
MGGGQSVLFTTDPRIVRNEREKVSECVGALYRPKLLPSSIGTAQFQ